MATLTNTTKNTVSIGNSTKEQERSFLLREALGFILLESGGKIVLVDHDITNTDKSPASLTNITKS